MPRHGLYDVAFGYQAADGIAVFHDQRSNTVLPHPLGGKLDRVGRADRDDVGAFAFQNILNNDPSSFLMAVLAGSDGKREASTKCLCIRGRRGRGRR